jgi:hypothetical protein
VLAITAKVVATCFALASFVATLILGVAADNAPLTTIFRAILAFWVCYLIGRVVGKVAQHAIDEHVTNYQHRHPLPQVDANLSRSAAKQPGVGDATSPSLAGPSS